jgi:hypothetical protein
VVEKGNLSESNKNNVRQGITDRGSSSVTDFVGLEVQSLQRGVLAAKCTRENEKYCPNIHTKCIETESEQLWVAILHVRQGVTDRTSTHVANLVVIEPQYSQRLVRTACDEKNMKFHKILPQYTCKMYKHRK